MKGQQSLFKIRDARAKDRFQMDDLYLNGWAKKCGWQATLVYVSLCRHANKEGTSFPSITLIAQELDVGRKTILKGIKSLLGYNIITAEKKRSGRGIFLSNTYVLMDKQVWKDNQVPVGDMDTPSPSQGLTKSLSGLNQVPVGDYKELSEGIKDKDKVFSEAKKTTMQKLQSEDAEDLPVIVDGEYLNKKKPNQNDNWNKFVVVWKAKCLKEKKIEPEVTLLKDKPIFHRINKIYTNTQMLGIIDFFLKSKKSDEHITISACFSADTINQYKLHERN